MKKSNEKENNIKKDKKDYSRALGLVFSTPNGYNGLLDFDNVDFLTGRIGFVGLCYKDDRIEPIKDVHTNEELVKYLIDHHYIEKKGNRIKAINN